MASTSNATIGICRASEDACLTDPPAIAYRIQFLTLNRSILITGCSSGIGYAVAHGLHAKGYRVFATARQQADVTRLQQQGLESMQLDLNDSQSIKHAVEQVLNKTDGKLYALFNNGAYGQPGAVEDLPRHVLKAQFETNVFGWLELTNLIIPTMRRQGYGRIIQNSSVLGLVAMPYRGAYNASKFALEGLTDTLRLELQGSGVYVSLIEPGPITSKFRSNALARFNAHIDKKQSFHREQYTAMLERLNKPGPAAPFTLPAEAVLKPVLHSLEHKHPRARYPVTVPTFLFTYLKRLLPTVILDRILRQAGK
jgi:NAD(P)-dependent dehydrogenase (short-subunit alcohol dehydrogenase family)